MALTDRDPVMAPAGAFAVIERRSDSPLIRLGVFTIRSLTVADVVLLAMAVGMGLSPQGCSTRPGRWAARSDTRRARHPTPADQPPAIVEGFQVAFGGAAIAAIVLAATLRASDTANINPEEIRSSGA